MDLHVVKEDHVSQICDPVFESQDSLDVMAESFTPRSLCRCPLARISTPCYLNLFDKIVFAIYSGQSKNALHLMMEY